VESFDEVSVAIESYFASLPGYQAGDLISRSHVASSLATLQNTGWEPAALEEILQLALADNSFLVTRFATPGGRRFMRKVAGQQGAYSRLDRLSAIPRGRTLVNDLIRQKGGDEFVRYLATRGGINLGQQLAGIPGGVDINKPTGRIYTADDLIAALERQWKSEFDDQ
jgi:hypothetical protein